MSRSVYIILSSVLSVVPVFAQGAHIMGIGDSLGEGDQSANAFTLSQEQAYLNTIATQAHVPLNLPLISSGKRGFVGVTNGRTRVEPSLHPEDLAVSGATVNDVLTDAASATIAHEVDLVLEPYTGMTQIQVVEQVKPGVLFCWVGNDDLINYILDFDHLNAPQNITPIASFTADFQSLMTRLKATGSKVVVGNIADLTKVGFLFDNDDLTKYLGQNYNLPAGSYTTFGAMVLIKMGIEPASILTSPEYVLTSMQLARIQNQIGQYNKVISAAAAANGFPVVDTFAMVNCFITKPITIEGVTITNHYNGGAFSLDGIHPSNTGYAIFANAFIKAANSGYNLTIPELTLDNEIAVFNADPFVDFNGNGIVPGRPNTGLLETEGPSIGVSGDMNDHPPVAVNPAVAAAPIGTAPSRTASAAAFMSNYFAAKGLNPNTAWQKDDVRKAVKEMLNSPE